MIERNQVIGEIGREKVYDWIKTPISSFTARMKPTGMWLELSRPTPYYY